MTPRARSQTKTTSYNIIPEVKLRSEIINDIVYMRSILHSSKIDHRGEYFRCSLKRYLSGRSNTMNYKQKRKGGIKPMKVSHINLSNEDAMVLQLISETGEEDLANLSRSLGMRRARVMASLESLRRKGLITIQRTASDWWVHISSKGKQMSTYIWPEMAMPAPSY